MDSKNHCDLFNKTWAPEFSQRRKLVNRKFLIDLQDEHNVDEGNLCYFITDFMGTALEMLEHFCRDISLEDVKSRKSLAGKRVIWVDDRDTGDQDEIGRGIARQYENPLTATRLLQTLTKPPFNQTNLSDAARRLIYITDLDPACIHALAATVYCHQVPALRNAIHNHLAFQPSIEVTIPSAGFLIFQLELHLPFFLLRTSKPPESSNEISSKSLRQWTDLSFLNLDPPKRQPQVPGEVWGMYEAGFSYAVAGSDNWRWTGYAFVDKGPDDPLTEPSEDAARETHLKSPLWRPRDHWLKVFDVRIEQVRKEWESFVYKLELAINQYMKDHPSNLVQRPGIAQDRTTEFKEAFDWASQALSLLRRLDSVLSALLKAWLSFSSAGGDIGYFLDPDTDRDAKLQPSDEFLCGIRVKFQRLEEYQDKIARLTRSCSDYRGTLKLCLNLDEKGPYDQNKSTSMFVLLTLFSIVLAAAIFSWTDIWASSMGKAIQD